MTNRNRPTIDPEDALLQSLMTQVVGQEGAALDGALDTLGSDPPPRRRRGRTPAAGRPSAGRWPAGTGAGPWESSAAARYRG